MTGIHTTYFLEIFGCGTKPYSSLRVRAKDNLASDNPKSLKALQVLLSYLQSIDGGAGGLGPWSFELSPKAVWAGTNENPVAWLVRFEGRSTGIAIDRLMCQELEVDIKGKVFVSNNETKTKTISIEEITSKISRPTRCL